MESRRGVQRRGSAHLAGKAQSLEWGSTYGGREVVLSGVPRCLGAVARRGLYDNELTELPSELGSLTALWML